MGNNQKDNYKSYISGLSLPLKIKESLLNKVTLDNNPQYYFEYPQLFSNYYTDVDQKIINQLSIAGFLYYESTLYMDALIDEKDASVFPLITISQEESIKILTSVFGLQSDFWKLWNLRRCEYFQAVAIEKQLFQKEIVSFSEYEVLADYKSAFGKVAIDCLNVYSNNCNKDRYELLLLSHRYFSIGFQLYDDVKDFKEDVTNRQFNWVLYLFKNQFRNEFETLDTNTCNKLLFIRGLAQNIIKEAISYFEKAAITIETIGISSKWQETIDSVKKEITSYLDITEGYLLTLNKRIELDQERNTSEFIDLSELKSSSVVKGLTYIQNDFNKNFSELKHVMYLSKQDGFENEEKVHVGDIFQRAMVADCIVSISKKHNLLIDKYLNNEIEYIIEKRNKDIVGAWSYFPTVKEIAADIDDLGQVIQLFIMSGRKDLIEKYCHTAIIIAIKERSCSNGGIETWIIPNANLSQLQKKQKYLNKTKWGVGPDVEVVANFIYALYIYNATSYTKIIETGINFIINEQRASGYWESRWYLGNLYGTYVCIRLLYLFGNKYIEQISKATNYVQSIQNKDGGWGLYHDSDALSTSLALLILNKFPVFDQEIINGKNYLLMSQLEDGSWNSIEFIKPRNNESYKSKTLTTAFALMAISI